MPSLNYYKVTVEINDNGLTFNREYLISSDSPDNIYIFIESTIANAFPTLSYFNILLFNKITIDEFLTHTQ